jgi:hypothetical protein
VCTSGGIFAYLSNKDDSNPSQGITCVPFEDVVESAKLAYYLVRILSVLGAL